MKMVAAAKYARAERELKPARVYGVGALALYEKAEIKVPEDKKKHLIIGVSSDRGLCGAIHTSVAKAMKTEISTLSDAGKEVMVVGVGDKLRGLLQRSVISYKTDEKPFYSLDAVAGAESISIYDDIDADVLRNYQEFILANILFYSLKESTTSEQSARMTAMDNASKNASEIIDKLTLTFNRTRQAVITKELIEIISGAAALKNNVLQFPQPGSKDAEERKEYIPDYMPPIVSSQEEPPMRSTPCTAAILEDFILPGASDTFVA
ncbi:ATP synthase subunit gamma [Chelonia mydas]|uniref:ATP synthase F(1) complex subunit gamma, mitochondrial n=1 Tax=Chelonia mydas TaxID=8469 RepID=M7BLT5_CHEMY|nr:ATP synthase subunit gamma [Chelonia mydas]